MVGDILWLIKDISYGPYDMVKIIQFDLNIDKKISTLKKFICQKVLDLASLRGKNPRE